MNDETADSLIKMQQLTTDICQTATYVDNDPAENTITLTDIRDSNTYLVRKLMDDKCWMVQNLRLGSDLGGAPLTPADTNISENWTLPQIDNITQFTGAYNNIPKVADPAYNESTECFSLKGSSDDCGLLYNWTAAIASNDSSGLSIGGTVAPNSICPKNWHLPTGGTQGEYVALDKAMLGNGDMDFLNPAAIARWTNSNQFAASFSGMRYLNDWYSTGQYGYYWSSTVTDSSLANSLSLTTDSDIMFPGTNTLQRSNGMSVRCVVN
jgi:uncharacterized protein (TIGR02145 family)